MAWRQATSHYPNQCCKYASPGPNELNEYNELPLFINICSILLIVLSQSKPVLSRYYWRLVIVEYNAITFNTLKPKQNGRHFADDIFKCIFLNENVWITNKISLKSIPKCPMHICVTLWPFWRRLPLSVGCPFHDNLEWCVYQLFQLLNVLVTDQNSRYKIAINARAILYLHASIWV